MGGGPPPPTGCHFSPLFPRSDLFCDCPSFVNENYANPSQEYLLTLLDFARDSRENLNLGASNLLFLLFPPLPADPYDQAIIAKDEVKEEEPEPFQKIGPSMTYRVCNLSN